jgi:hypothetical protein
MSDKMDWLDWFVFVLLWSRPNFDSSPNDMISCADERAGAAGVVMMIPVLGRPTNFLAD